MLAVSGPVISRYVGATPAQPVAEVATT
jgi:hypothetical protein